jgi:hypothetical protein
VLKELKDTRVGRGQQVADPDSMESVLTSQQKVKFTKVRGEVKGGTRLGRQY